MKRTLTYRVRVRSNVGVEYQCELLTWPTIAHVREILDDEVAWLKRAAHSMDFCEEQDKLTWDRISELKDLIALLGVLPSGCEPTSTPYTYDIRVGGRLVGNLSITDSPAWTCDAVEKATGAVDAPSDSGI